MNILRIGPEGLLLVEAAAISILVAIATWRHFGFRAAALVTMTLALAVALWNSTLATPDLPHRVLVALFVVVPSVLLLGASFVIVPSVILLGASRLRWLAARPWALLVAGPLAFVGCYVGLCACAVKVGAI